MRRILSGILAFMTVISVCVSSVDIYAISNGYDDTECIEDEEIIEDEETEEIEEIYDIPDVQGTYTEYPSSYAVSTSAEIAPLTPTMGLLEDGYEATEVLLPADEYRQLTAVDYTGTASYFQWQILIGDDIWADITGENNPTINLSYAMIASMLGDKGYVTIRCYSNGIYGEQITESINVIDIDSFGMSFFDAPLNEDEVVPPPMSIVVAADAVVIDPTAVAGASDAVIQDNTAATANAPLPADTTDGQFAASDENTVPTDDSTVIDYNNHTITVNYVLEDYTPETMLDNQVAVDPWTATLAAGSELVRHITPPVVIGYTQKTMVCNITDGSITYDDSTKSLDINIASINQDIVVYIVYIPDTVSFTVKHYLQAVATDDYELVEGETQVMQGKTNQLISEFDNLSYAFLNDEFLRSKYCYALSYDSNIRLAADGTTVIEIYYDRYYFLMDFKLGNGGYGIQPIYAKYGTPITAKSGIAHRPGFTFVGWTLIDPLENDFLGEGARFAHLALQYTNEQWAITIPAYMPCANLTYQAEWIDGPTSFTVEYLLQDANEPEKYNYFAHQTFTTYAAQDVQNSGKTVVSGQDITYILLNVLNDAGKEETNRRASAYHYEKVLDVNNPNFGLSANERRASYLSSNQRLGDNLQILTDAAGNVTGIWDLSTGQEYRLTVAHDGSTTIRIYYDRVEFTLKFYYAATKDSQYYVVGNSTYYFGKLADIYNKADDVALMDSYFTTHFGEVGNVSLDTSKYLFMINREYVIEKHYLDENGNEIGKKPSDYSDPSITPIYHLYEQPSSVTGYTYHYLTFTARFGQDLTDLWPTSKVFNPMNTSWGKTAMFSGWNPEYSVKYVHTHENQTVKGVYPELDDQMLFYSDLDGIEKSPDKTMAFLAFWENGAVNNWAANELYRYNICYALTPSETERLLAGGYDYWFEKDSNNIYKIRYHDGKFYSVFRTYDVIDNSDINQQTKPSVPGLIDHAFSGYAGVSYADYINGVRPSTTILTFNNTVSAYDYVTLDVNSFKDEDGNNIYDEAYEIYYYYDRYSYNITYDNGSIDDPNVVATVLYGDKLVNYDTPHEIDPVTYPDPNTTWQEAVYPYSMYDDGAVTFAGWYEDAQLITPFVIDDSTVMLDNDIHLHAKWIETTFNVSFYLTEDDMNKDNILVDPETGNPFVYDVKYNNIITGNEIVDLPTEADVINGDLTFAGWFYLCEDHNEIEAFSPKVPITQDMKIFGKWNSNVMQEYKVEYILVDDNENPVDADLTLEGLQYTYVADPIMGTAFAGNTKTFDAKYGDQLYEAYQPVVQGTNVQVYLPLVASSSITLIETQDDGDNILRFGYRKISEVGYTVEYRYAETDELIPMGTKPNPVTGVTSDVILTEKFVLVDGYTPDAYQKRLILSSNAEENVITFYYTENTAGSTQAPILYTYYIEKLEYAEGAADTDKYDIYKSWQELGEVGTDYTIPTLNLEGFSEVTADTYSGTLTDAGLELSRYFVRNTYTYEFQYWYIDVYNQPVGEMQFMSFSGSDKFGKIIEHGVLDIPGYKMAANQTKTQTITVGNNTTEGASQVNIRKIYYEQLYVDFNYVLEAPAYAGLSLDTVLEHLASTYVATDVTTHVKGATAPKTPDEEKYRFMGWYVVENGNYVKLESYNADKYNVELVVNEDGSVALKPKRITATTGEGTSAKEIEYFPVGGTYYARYEALETSIVIERTNVNLSDVNQSFIYNIKNNSGDVILTVVVNIPANSTSGSVTVNELPVGTYTVEEVTDWSWRYDPTGQDLSIKLIAESMKIAKATFDGTTRVAKWLDGNGYSGRNRLGN